MADIFKKLHGSGVDTKVPFEVFDMVAGYENIIKEKRVPVYDNYMRVKDEVMRIKHIMEEEREIKKVPPVRLEMCLRQYDTMPPLAMEDCQGQ